MIKISVNVPVQDDTNLNEYIARKLRINKFSDVIILKKSVDARDKGAIVYSYTVAVSLADESGYPSFVYAQKRLDDICQRRAFSGARPIVVGAGPAGLFAALTLCAMGQRPIIIERGKEIDERKKDVEGFNKGGGLNVNSNVQFGEGGAGAFSDGKLNTGINSEFVSVVLNELVAFGAPKEILYLAKPHIGTDKLTAVVKNIRAKIEERGGEFMFGTRLTDIVIKDGRVTGAVTDKGTIDTDTIYLAIGHSARDTYETLCAKNVDLVPKPFSVGVRIEHLQETISRSQYGNAYKLLPPAEYKCVEHIDAKRTLYSFCMCPGGRVINASSENNGLCVNGMSFHARDEKNANSALCVNIETADFGGGVLDGIAFQRALEAKAFSISNSHKPPVQTYGDFVKGTVTTNFGSVKPSVETGFVYGDLNAILPKFVSKAIAEGVKRIARKIKGFDASDAILTAVETRTSSPVRILRGEDFSSSVQGLYPIGEGAGYAGGITSSAVDGIRCVLKSKK